LRYGEKMLTKIFVIWECKDKTEDWEKWNWNFKTKKDAENWLLDYWKDLDLGQVDYKMDNFQIEEDFV